MKLRSRFALLPLFVWLAGCASVSTPTRSVTMQGIETRTSGSITDGVQKKVLDNGLTVLVREDHRSSVVAVVTHVKAGYFHEDDDVAGISHVIEHMFFNGTPSRPGSEDISRETKGYGGSLNAGTIYDRTTYYVVLPSDRWREGLSIQADAYLNPLFDEDVLAKEMEAILQEARRKLDNPSAYGREKLYELAFDRHRMRRWRIGQEDVLRSLTRDDLVRYYEDHYRPRNTVLTIVGDVDAAAVFAEVENLYGAEEEGLLRKHGGPDEPAQTAFRYRRELGELSRNYIFLGFHTPGEDHPDNAPLDILASILTSGRSSRLVSRIKEDLGVVTNIDASSFQFEDVGLFEIDAICGLNEVDRAVREIFVQLERIRHFGITQEEVDKAKVAVYSAQAFAQEEVLGQASALARYEALGDHELWDRRLADLAAVNPADVQRVASQYLTLDNASLLEYCRYDQLPGRDETDMRGHIEGSVLADVHRLSPFTLPEPGPSLLPREELVDWSRRFVAAEPMSATPQRYRLSNGTTLLVYENPGVSTTAVSLLFRGGRVDEVINSSGITQMMQRLMVKETKNREASRMAFEIESLGTSLRQISSDDYFGFATSTLTSHMPFAIDVLMDAVMNPEFSLEQLVTEREAQLSAIAGIEDQSARLAVQFLRDSIFPNHPYGYRELGHPTVIEYVDPNRIYEHHRDTVRPETAVISISGNVQGDVVRDFLERYARDWVAVGDLLPTTASEFYSTERYATVAPLFSSREDEISKDRSQSALFLAFPTVPATHADTYPLDVLQSITGGLGGTFFEEIRTKRGLAYQVSTVDRSLAMAGYFGTFVACSPDDAETVKELVIELTNQLADTPPTADQIAQAKNHLAGSHRVGLQTNTSQSSYRGVAEILGIDEEELARYEERIRAVTVDDISRVVSEYLHDKPYALGAVVGRSGKSATPN